MSKIKLTLSALISLLCLLFVQVKAQAGPMGFKDSAMLMGDVNNNWRESFINYALTPRDALGVGVIYMRSDDKSQTYTLEEVNVTQLLQRWNLPHAQANFWFQGGIGALQGDEKKGASFDKIAFTPGLQFDYETTRIYFAANYRFYRASNINLDYSSLRAGFSFYETDYDQTQPWLILEARNMNHLSDKVEITPMLRLINKNFFIEAGVNNAHEPRFNFMYIF